VLMQQGDDGGEGLAEVECILEVLHLKQVLQYNAAVASVTILRSSCKSYNIRCWGSNSAHVREPTVTHQVAVGDFAAAAAAAADDDDDVDVDVDG